LEKEEILEELKKLKPIDWFAAYQTVRIDGEVLLNGWRDKDLSRIEKFRPEDFKDKVVLDIGCSAGALCIIALEMGAKAVYGVDCMDDVIDLAKKIAELTRKDIKYAVANVKYPDFSKKVKNAFGLSSFDTVFFLSVVRSCGPPTQYGGTDEVDYEVVFNNLNAFTKEVLYFEGHGQDTEGQYREQFSRYLNSDHIEFLGMNTDTKAQPRPFFRCLMR